MQAVNETIRIQKPLLDQQKKALAFIRQKQRTTRKRKERRNDGERPKRGL